MLLHFARLRQLLLAILLVQGLIQDLDVGGGVILGGGGARRALDKVVHGRLICPAVG